MIATVASIALVCVTGACIWVVSIVFRDARVRERGWEKKEATWAEDRQQLLDRIMFLADRPWGSPPTEVEEYEEPIPESYNPMEAPIASVDFDYYSNPSGVV